MTLKELFNKVETVNEFYDKVTYNRYPHYYVEFSISNLKTQRAIISSFCKKSYEELQYYINLNFNKEFIDALLSSEVRLTEDQRIFVNTSNEKYKVDIYISDWYDEGDD